MTVDGTNSIAPRNVSASTPLSRLLAARAAGDTAPLLAGDRALGRRASQGSGLTGPFKQPNLEAIDWSRVPDPASRQFGYEALPLPDMSGALAGKISGHDTNELIVGAYQHFDQAFSRYLGDPPVANWTTFGKFAAREAGQEIVRLERELQAFQALPPDPIAVFDATRDLVKNPSLIGRFGVPLIADALRKADLSLDDLTAVFAGGWGIATKLPKFIKFTLALRENMETLLSGLLKVHVGIYENFGGVFDTFLQAEANGQEGVTAVKAKIDAGEFSDPNGLLLDALSLYKAARHLQQKAVTTKDPAVREQLLERRAELAKRATLLIGLQEQYGVAQNAAFDDPNFRALLQELSECLSIRDGSGRTELQKHGNWADFTTRMGLVELRPEQLRGRFDGNADPNGRVFRLRDHQGNPRYFTLNPDEKAREGTITAYFDNGATGEVASTNIRTAPPPLELQRPGGGRPRRAIHLKE